VGAARTCPALKSGLLLSPGTQGVGEELAGLILVVAYEYGGIDEPFEGSIV
jgi:hypothetical protein